MGDTCLLGLCTHRWCSHSHQLSAQTDSPDGTFLKNISEKQSLTTILKSDVYMCKHTQVTCMVFRELNAGTAALQCFHLSVALWFICGFIMRTLDHYIFLAVQKGYRLLYSPMESGEEVLEELYPENVVLKLGNVCISGYSKPILNNLAINLKWELKIMVTATKLITRS